MKAVVVHQYCCPELLKFEKTLPRFQVRERVSPGKMTLVAHGASAAATAAFFRTCNSSGSELCRFFGAI